MVNSPLILVVVAAFVVTGVVVAVIERRPVSSSGTPGREGLPCTRGVSGVEAVWRVGALAGPCPPVSYRRYLAALGRVVSNVEI